jgi:ketosteroid isomerase-like protein
MESPIRRAEGADRDQERMIDQIRRALESNDLAAFAALYAEDATLEEVSSLNPPSHPHVVKGREAILKRLRDDLIRDPVSGWSRQVANSAIVDQVESDEAVAFTEVRTFAAGDKAVAQHLCHKENGLITYDRLVVAWDAAA